MISVTSIPDTAAVYIDDRYVGSTPLEIFITAETHTLRIDHTGFAQYETTLQVPGRRLMSLFFPSRMTVDTSLDLQDPSRWITRMISDTASVSRVTEVSEKTFHDDLFHEMETVVKAYTDDFTDEQIKALLYITGSLVSNEQLLDEYQAMILALEHAGIIPTERHTGTPWYLPLADPDNMYYLAITGNTDSVREFAKDLIHSYDIQSKTVSHPTQGRIERVHNDYYISIDAQNMLIGDTDFADSETPDILALPYVAAVDSYAIRTQEVSEQDYAEFVKENPAWSLENLPELLAKGLVDEQYLNDVDLSHPQDVPIRSISWYAAQSYCSWRTSLLQMENPTMSITLPSSAEWEIAARIFPSTYVSSFTRLPAESYQPYGMLGSVWEFCGDSYTHIRPMIMVQGQYELADDALSAIPDCIVKGGSWMQQAKQVGPETIGAFPKSMTSRYIGFRTVVRK